MSAELKASSFDKSNNSKILLEEAEKKIFTLSDRNETTQVHGMTEIVSRTIEIIEKNYQKKNELTGIPSGIARLDTMTSGFQKSEMIIIGDVAVSCQNSDSKALDIARSGF